MEKREKEDSYSHILKYTGLFGGVQGLNILVGIVRNKLVAMILGPDGMGLVSLFNSTIKLVSDSTNFGLSMSAVKNVSETIDTGNEDKVREAVRLIRSWSLLTALLGMLLCIVLSSLLSRWTFAWGNHTLHFILLSPVVALMAIAGGETAILKGARQLRNLAIVSVYNMLFALVCSVPIYYFFGQAGIVPSLVLLALAQCVTTIYYSYKLYRPSFSFSIRYIHQGEGMIRLGIAFVLAGILGSGAEFVLRSYLNNTGELYTVGLYNAGYVMTMTYAGMVFSAMETDYFPRLSGITSLGPQLNQMVNHQIEVSLLLVSPMLALFMVMQPILLPLLYSGKFMPVLGMMKIAVLAMYFRALTLPVEYIALSRGDSRGYLFLEAVYDIAFVLLVIVGYKYLGLVGTGVGLAFAGLINLVVVFVYARWKYGYSIASTVKLYTLIQLPLGIATCMVTYLLDGIFYWMVGLLLAFVSLGISVQILRSKTNLWNALVEKISFRFHQKGKGVDHD
ncbi:MAG: oligosaccharide flippase family protein [Prevotella sp.]|nr:oligosaccharide flippase family protein [Prevotella sp.]